MICLTCDVHHRSLNMPYMPFSDKSELEVAGLFSQLLEHYNIRATMFLTAKCFSEEWQNAAPLCDNPLIEIGGHNYFCFQPFFMHRVIKKIIGPYRFQFYDIWKTKTCIRKKTGRAITAWRNHMLIHGPFTERVLSDLQLTFCSDECDPSSTGPVLHESGIYNFPINIISDYDHVYHAHRTEAFVKSHPWNDAFSDKSYHIDEWVDIVIDQINGKLRERSTVNILIHPITMYLCDRFDGVDRILRVISRHENCTYRELPQQNGIRHS